MKIVLLHGMSCRLENCWGPYVKELAEKYKAEFLAPQCTLKRDITLDNWIEEVDRFLPKFDETTIFICHSLSTLFIVKYLSMRKLKPLALICVSGGKLKELKDAVYEYLRDFGFSDKESSYVTKNVKNRYHIHSNNDDIWSPEQIADYSKSLKATDITLNGGGHLGRNSGIKEINEIDLIIKNIIKNNQVEI